MGFAFRRIYRLAPTDPRYLDASEADIVVDVWAHQFADNPKLYDEEENDTFAEDLAAMEAELGIPAWEDDDTRGVTPNPTPEPTPEPPPPEWQDKPGDWEDVVNDRSAE